MQGAISKIHQILDQLQQQAIAIDQQNTQKVEFRTTGKQDDKNFSRLKLFNWRLFHPMAITNCDSLLDKLEAEGEFFLGHVRETRIGVNVQRMLCKRLLETVEVLHQIQTYLGEKGAHFGIDFKFFNSYQIDFHFPIDRN